MTKKNKQSRGDMGWHFPSLDHGSADGFSDPLLEYFGGNHERYVAREAIQNSIDARNDKSMPVKVVFERKTIASKNLPGLQELKKRIKLCLSHPHVSEKAQKFYSASLNVSGADEISLLRISDYNTFGLDGADELTLDNRKGRWHLLVRAIGENERSGVGGGSFGIGKGAPFAASLLRTVYYSTLNGDGEHIFQGKAKLITHEFEGDMKRGEGFYGIDGYRSVRNYDEIPQEFRRSDRGTDLYIAGYDFGRRDWVKGMAKSVLANFWMAIFESDLEVELMNNGKTEMKITRENLAEHLEKLSRNEAYPYFMAVVQPTREEIKHLPVVGSCKLFIRRDESFPKRVALMRKAKMVVKEKQFRIMQDGYAGVFICDDDQGNWILRDMEPPQHDDWIPERQKEHGTEALQTIYGWIRETLREMAGEGGGDPEDIPGLDQFLPYEEDADTESSQGAAAVLAGTSSPAESGHEVGAEREEEPDEIQDIVKRASATHRGSGSDAGSTGAKGPAEIETAGSKGGKDDGEALTRINTTAIKFRTIAASGKQGGLEYCLILDPLSTQEGAINIVGVGDDANYPVELDGAENWETGKKVNASGSMIRNIKLEKGERLRLRLRLKSRGRYALGIESYEN